MTRDNVTGKNKDFYDLGKKIFDRLNPQGAINPKVVEQREWVEDQAPVAVWELQENGWDTIADRDWMESLPIGTKLYTAPPKKKWVGLTADELNMIGDRMRTWNSHSLTDIYVAIEAKLREKNG